MKKDIMLDAHSVADLLSVSESKAYKIIRALNDLMIDEGIPKECIIAGKISEKYLKDKLKIWFTFAIKGSII